MVLTQIATSIEEHKRNRPQVSDGDDGLVQALSWWKVQSEQNKMDLTAQFRIAVADDIQDFYWQNPCSVGA